MKTQNKIFALAVFALISSNTIAQTMDSTIVKNNLDTTKTSIEKSDTKFLSFDKQKFNNWIHSLQISDSLKKNTSAQVTFIYPLGSNGINAPKSSNNFSLNALWGINGGVKGVEIGGWVNVNNGSVMGVQFAGTVNATHGESGGVIIAGVSNIGSKNAYGLHLAGISNTYMGKNIGIFGAGICNLATDSVMGFQISGIANYSNQSTIGMQISTVNATRKSLIGTQIGVINVAKKLSGTQFGILNISDSIQNGCPIGFLNIVRHGLFEFELGSNEFANQFNFKVGTDRFYTIFKLGKVMQKESVFTTGLGWGTYLPLGEKHLIAFDLSANNFWNQDFNKSSENKLLTRADISYKWRFSKHFSLFAGPSLSYLLSDTQKTENIPPIVVPKTVLDSKSDNLRHQLWIGFNAGLSFKF